MYMFDTKSRIARGGPSRSSRPQASASGAMRDARRDSRPDGGSANGVSLSRTAKTKARTRPRTKTGVETPRLATTIVPTSTGELRRMRRERAQGDADDGREDQGEERQLDGHRQALDEDVGDRPAEPDRAAEVALDELAEVDDELVRDRLVEAVADARTAAHSSGVAFSP